MVYYTLKVFRLSKLLKSCLFPMCLNLHINPPKIVQPFAPRSYFVPCGHCKDCDEVFQASWSFRLRVELEHLALQGWKIAFATLTYKDLCLPHLPPCVFKEKIKYRAVQCFSRSDATSFIHALRSYLWREYHLEGQLRLRYFLCSEFGSDTKRSHYHLVLAFPPCVDAVKLFNKVHRLWEPKGHVFPRYFEGGIDSKGYRHKPFVVTSPSAAARYIAKYTTKDMYYYEHLQAHDLSFSDFNTKMDVYRDCRQFHLGSRSLGLSILDNLDDKRKLAMLKGGYSFAGDTKLYTLPVYLKNRLIFDNVYQYRLVHHYVEQPDNDELYFVDTKRIVKREANAFFLEHYREIYDLKVKKYTELFRKMTSTLEYSMRSVDVCLARDSISFLHSFCALGYSLEDVAKLYLSYYGVPFDKVKHYSLDVAWLNHYIDVDSLDKLFSFRGFYALKSDFYQGMQAVFSWCFSVFFGERKTYNKNDKLLKQIKDFFGHAV